MKRAQITQVINRRNAADEARQRYDDASAGVDENQLHNAKARLDAADALTDATYELIHCVENLLTEVSFEHGGADISDLFWLLNDDKKEAHR